MQCGGQGETAEEDVDDRVGKAGQGLFGSHAGHAADGCQHRHDECGDRDVQGLGEPQDGHEQQDGQTLVGGDVVGKHRVHHPRDDGSRHHREQRLVGALREQGRVVQRGFSSRVGHDVSMNAGAGARHGAYRTPPEV